MKKASSLFQLMRGTTNRFGRSRLGGGFTTANSNTRILQPIQSQPNGIAPAPPAMPIHINLGLNSDRARGMMIERLRGLGIEDERVLAAMQAVPRHIFVDQGLASRAYDNDALPLGYGQTISQPWIVARMISLLCLTSVPNNVLEIGAGCGYQAAVLSQLIPEVFAIERIEPLYKIAQANLHQLGLTDQIHLKFADGMLGWPNLAPFDAIIIAAAGLQIPTALLQQLSIGGRLIAPVGGESQNLVYIQRTAKNEWQQHELEAVRFVPLKSGIQI